MIDNPEIEQIYTFLRHKISEVIENPESIENITVNSNLNESGLTSLELIKLIVQIEKTFGFDFDDDEMVEDNFTTIEKIAESIIRKIGEKDPSTTI